LPVDHPIAAGRRPTLASRHVMHQRLARSVVAGPPLPPDRRCAGSRLAAIRRERALVLGAQFMIILGLTW